VNDTSITADPVATAEALDDLLARTADQHGLDVLSGDARRMLHAVIVALENAERRLSGLHEKWAFQYTSYGVTETSLVCSSREEAEHEAGRHRRGDRIVHRLCGDWEAIDSDEVGAQ
jgi:hypothetical protein